MSLDDVIKFFADLQELAEDDPEAFHQLIYRLAKTWLMIQAISSRVMMDEIKGMDIDDIEEEFIARVIKDIGGEA